MNASSKPQIDPVMFRELFIEPFVFRLAVAEFRAQCAALGTTVRAVHDSLVVDCPVEQRPEVARIATDLGIMGAP